jgi:hypothetical protein
VRAWPRQPAKIESLFETFCSVEAFKPLNIVQLTESEQLMPDWSQANLHEHMHVYSVDNQNLGHVAEVFEDSFLIHKGFFFPKDRYIPYSAIATVDNDRVQLTMTADEIKDKEWEKRPDYENHPGDPTQLFYDRGHGVSDPFDETNPNRT